MTELSKYIGPDVDLPGMGEGVSANEIGYPYNRYLLFSFEVISLLRYLYGQYKRINHHCGQIGKGLLWGGTPQYEQVTLSL